MLFSQRTRARKPSNPRAYDDNLESHMVCVLCCVDAQSGVGRRTTKELCLTIGMVVKFARHFRSRRMNLWGVRGDGGIWGGKENCGAFSTEKRRPCGEGGFRFFLASSSVISGISLRWPSLLQHSIHPSSPPPCPFLLVRIPIQKEKRGCTANLISFTDNAATFPVFFFSHGSTMMLGEPSAPAAYWEQVGRQAIEQGVERIVMMVRLLSNTEARKRLTL